MSTISFLWSKYTKLLDHTLTKTGPVFGEQSTTNFAFWAMTELSKELDKPDLSKIAFNVYHEYFERKEKGHYTPKENIEWAREILKRFTDELPPDTFTPFR